MHLYFIFFFYSSIQRPRVLDVNIRRLLKKSLVIAGSFSLCNIDLFNYYYFGLSPPVLPFFLPQRAKVRQLLFGLVRPLREFHMHEVGDAMTLADIY